MAETLWESIKTLEPLQPRFVSVTYGAGGSTRERTHATVDADPSRKPTLDAGRAPDLRRRDPRRDRRRSRATIGTLGVRHIVALARRSARAGRASSRRIRTAIANAAELVAGLKKVAPFEISVAAYPEMPSRCADAPARPRQSEAQGRRRRRPRDHPVLLLGRLLLPLPRPRRGGRHRRRDRARHPAGHQCRADSHDSRPVRRRRSRTGWTACSKGSTTIPPRASWSPPPSPPSCAASSTPAASANSISTR